MPLIDIPTVGVVEFPDSMTKDEIERAIRTNILPFEPTIGGYVKETLKAPLRGAAGFLESAVTGAASVLPEEYEKKVTEYAHKFAQKAPQVAPGYEGTLPVQIAEGLGSSVAPMLIPGGALTRFGFLGAAGAGEARQRAQAAGATPEQKGEATAQGIMPGLLDMLPIEYLLMGRGKLGKDLLDRAVRMTVAGGIQGATEGAQELWQNSIAQGYDPKQGLYANVPESIEVGAGVGAIAQGLMDLVFGRRAGKVKTPSAPQAPQQAQDLETIQRALTQAPEAEQVQGAAPTLTSAAQTVVPETQAAPTVTTIPKKRGEKKIEVPGVEVPAEAAAVGTKGEVPAGAAAVGTEGEVPREGLFAAAFKPPSEPTGNPYIDKAQQFVDYYDSKGGQVALPPHVFASNVKQFLRDLNGTDVRPRGMAPDVYRNKLIDNLRQAIADARTELQGGESARRGTAAAEPTVTGTTGQPAAGEGISEPVPQQAPSGTEVIDAGRAGVDVTGEPAARPVEGKGEERPALSAEEQAQLQKELEEETAGLGKERRVGLLKPSTKVQTWQFQQLRNDIQTADTTKSKEEYEGALDRIVDAAEEIFGEGSSDATKNAASKAMLEFSDAELNAARSRLREKASRVRDKDEVWAARDLAVAQKQVLDLEENLETLKAAKPRDGEELVAVNTGIAETKAKLSEAKKELRELKKKGKPRTSLGEVIEPTGNTKADVEKVIQPELRRNSELAQAVKVVQTEAELPSYLQKPGTRGVTANGRIWLVADNIQPGEELGVFLHEAGAHIGFDKMLNILQRKQLADVVRGWGRGNDLKGQVAKEAISKGSNSDDEVIAYAVEGLVNRGVKPTTFSADSNWLRRIFSVLRDALRRFGFTKDVTPQELVDMAYGAAHIETIRTDIKAAINAETTLFGQGLGPRGGAALQEIRGSYNDIRESYGLEPVTDWSKLPEELVAPVALHKKKQISTEPRYSAANAAIANAKDTADTLFTGPSAPKNIIDRAIEGFAGPDKFKKVGKLSEIVRTKLADKTAPWKDFLQGVHQGKVLDDMGNANAVERIEASSKTSGIQHAVMERGGLRIDPKTGMWHAYKTDASYKDIIETLNKAVGKYDDMDSFSDVEKFFNLAGIARRENELLKSGKLGSGEGMITPTLDKKQMRQGLDLYNSIPEFREALKTFETLNNRLVDSMVQAGVFDAEYAKQLKGTTGYVPWFRFSTEKDGGVRVLKPREFTRGLIYLSNMKDLKGAPIEDVKINNLLDNMATLSNWMVAKSIGNDTARYMGELGVSLGIAKRVGGIEGGEKGQVIKVYDKGEERFYAFDDPAFIPAFKGNEIVLGSLTKMLSIPANLTRRAITVVNPVFAIAQLPQDAMRAFVEGGLKNPWSIFPKVLTNFTKELLNPSDTSIRLMEYGIKGRGSDIIAGEAKRTFRRRLGYYDSSIAGYGEKGWDFLERIQSASDAAIRSALYDLTMKETGNEVLALKRAREIINFDTQGSSQISTFLRSTVPFMGVQIIALNNLYRGLVLGQRMTDGDKAATRKAIYASGMQLVAMSILYTMLVSDDDDYKQRSDEERAHSFIVPGLNLRIPTPSDGIGFMFKVMPELMTRYVMSDAVKDPDMGSRTLRGMGVGLLGVADWIGFIPMLGNPAVKTFLELKLNKSFFTGDPIVGKGQEGKEPFAQYTEATSELAKLVGQVSKDASQILPKQYQDTIQISPIKFDYLLKAVTSQVGASVMVGMNSMFHAAEGKVSPSMELKDFPLWKRFTFSDKDRADLEDFYEMREKIDQITRTYRDFITSGRGKEAVDYMNDPENRRAMAVRKYATGVEEALTKFRQARKLIINDPNIKDPDEMQAKLKEIDAQQTKFLQSIQLAKARALAGI